MATNWDEIRHEWETTKITLKDLADKHNVKLGTLKSRKSREGWVRGEPKQKDATIQRDATPQRKRMQPKKEKKEPIVESDNLTDKQRLFCIYYIKCFNATKAYQKAYDCDYVSAMSNGSRLLRNDKVSDEIDRMRSEMLSEKKISADDVLQRYIDIALADIGDYVKVAGGGFSVIVKPLDEMDTSIISELSNTENGIKLKLADKMKALDMLAKFTDLLSDNDKKRFEVEKLKAETEKAKAEAERIVKENADDETEEIVIVDAWSDDDE